MTSPMTNSPVVSPECPAVVFINLSAGAGHARSCLRSIQKRFSELQFHVKFRETGSAQELESCAKEAMTSKTKLLIAMGGDGTFQGLVNAAFGADVLLGILPAGGGNDFAAAIGLPRDPVLALEAMLRGKAHSVD